jgi:transcriptional regulator with XRE-family HTH domain
MTIGTRIKECRRKANLSQVELAERVGVSQTAISQWESCEHEPSSRYIMPLAEAVGVSAEYLLKGHHQGSTT